MNLLKKELLNHKNLILKYKTLIPAPQLPKFEKDIETIFHNFENIEEEHQLSQITKLAKSKFNALKKIYGDISQDKSEKFDFYDKDSKKIVEDLTEDLKIEEDTNPNFKELLNSPGFNPSLVKKYREEYNRISKDINVKYFEALEKKTKTKFINKTEEDLKNDPNIKQKMKEHELERLKDYFSQVGKDYKDKEGKEVSLDEESLKDLVDKMFNGGELTDKDKANLEKFELQRIHEEKKSGDTTETDNLFKGDTRQNVHLELTEEQQKELDIQLDKILSDDKFTEHQKSDKCLKLIWETENQILKSQCDGEVSLDQYGNFQFKVYEEEEESSSGTKTFVFRDGKLVEGKAKRREVVVYSNWHSGNLNPDDLQKHRSLLDRQHFRGPLWEGIGRPQSIMDDPNVLLHRPPPDSKDVSVDKLKPGKQSWEEIDR